MKIAINTIDDHIVVGLEGRLDTMQSESFEKKLLEALEAGNKKIIIDCQCLEYISSSGLRVFLIAQKKISAQSGQFKICNLQPIIKEIFEISGFMMVFSVFADLDSALKA
jgi:anti-anti-sigma factor